MRYFIEQCGGRFYSGSELDIAKRRASRMSHRKDEGVYLIAEKYNREIGDYEPCGSIAYFSGYQDAKEGCLA